MTTIRTALAAAIFLACAFWVANRTAYGALATDPNAMAGFRGTEYFEGVLQQSGFVLWFAADVDFAVYAPGNFNLSFPGSDPSGGTQYVYAYQMHHVGNSTAPPPSVAGLTGTKLMQKLNLLSIGLDQTVQPTVANNTWIDNDSLIVEDPVPALIGPGGMPPYTSVQWTYTSGIQGMPTVPGGQFSEILLFTSPLPPEFYNASVKGGSVTRQRGPIDGTRGLPSPVPEPSTGLILLTATTVVMLSRRRE